VGEEGLKEPKLETENGSGEGNAGIRDSEVNKEMKKEPQQDDGESDAKGAVVAEEFLSSSVPEAAEASKDIKFTQDASMELETKAVLQNEDVPKEEIKAGNEDLVTSAEPTGFPAASNTEAEPAASNPPTSGAMEVESSEPALETKAPATNTEGSSKEGVGEDSALFSQDGVKAQVSQASNAQASQSETAETQVTQTSNAPESKSETPAASAQATDQGTTEEGKTVAVAEAVAQSNYYSAASSTPIATATSMQQKNVEDLLKQLRFHFQTSFCTNCGTQIEFPLDSMIVQCPKCNFKNKAGATKVTECFNCKRYISHPATSAFIQCPLCFFLMNPMDPAKKAYPPDYKVPKKASPPVSTKKRKRTKDNSALEAKAFNLYCKEGWRSMVQQTGVQEFYKVVELLKQSWSTQPDSVKLSYQNAVLKEEEKAKSTFSTMHLTPPLGHGNVQQQGTSTAASIAWQRTQAQYALQQAQLRLAHAQNSFTQISNAMNQAITSGNPAATQLRLQQMQAYQLLSATTAQLNQLMEAQQYVQAQGYDPQYSVFGGRQPQRQRLDSLKDRNQVVKMITSNNVQHV